MPNEPVVQDSLDAALAAIPKGWKVVLGQGNIYRLDNPGALWAADLVKLFHDADGKPGYWEAKVIDLTPTLALHRAIAMAEAKDREAG